MAKKKPKKSSILSLKNILIVTSLFLIGILFSIFGIWFYLQDKFYPGVKIANIDLTALTREEARQLLTVKIAERENYSLNLLDKTNERQEYKLELKDNIETNIDQSLQEAFSYGHEKLPFSPKPILLKVSFDKDLENNLSEIALLVDKVPIASQLKVEGEQINVTPSQDGLILDQDEIKKTISDYINGKEIKPELNLPLKIVSPNLTYDQALNIKKRLDEIKLSPIVLKSKDQEFTLDLEAILSLIDLENTKSSVIQAQVINSPLNIESIKIGGKEISDTKLTLNEEKLDEYLKDISSQIDRPVKEPLFSFDGNRVTEFQPPQIGRKLNIESAKNKIALALINHNQTEVELPVEEVSPKNKLTNDLGIKELIGEGMSNFSGSIENRIYNVGLGASKINGILIAPGEEFSFNKIVGDISASTGFKQAYVIKSGRTVLDDGGGICQVSTTLFRAVLNAGLPITARTAHAYRVGYYEQGFPPGLDATIFHPSVDFKFKNDTGSHILIQTSISGTSLYIDLYGTSDGRTVNITTPIMGTQTPPPPELRQDDPTLPRGTVKQVDWAAWGAKVTFRRTVKRGGEVLINESYTSNYRPWQAVYLVGTKDG